MADVLVDESVLSGIASALRVPLQTTTTYKPSQMANAVAHFADPLLQRTMTSYTDTNIVSIGSYTFAGCSSLKQVDFPNLETIGPDAFFSCKQLTSVNAPKVKNVMTEAFCGCNGSCPLSPRKKAGPSARTVHGASVNASLTARFPFRSDASLVTIVGRTAR